MRNVVLGLSYIDIQFFARDFSRAFLFLETVVDCDFLFAYERQLKATGRKGAAGFSKTVN